MTGWDWGHDDNVEIELEVTKDFEAYIDVDFDTDITYESYYDPEVNVDVCVDIDGNFAGFNVDVQAFGEDTSTEVNLVVITTDEYSGIALTGYSAVA